MTVSTAFIPTRDLGQPSTNRQSPMANLLISLRQTMTQRVWGAIALGVALTAIAFASTLIMIAEQDLSPRATVFDRLLLAALAFVIWSRWQLPTPNRAEPDGAEPDATETSDAHQVRDRSKINAHDFILFGVAGSSFALSLTCSAWSLTQTSVANSTLLNNLMPIFTTLGAWLFLKQQFSLRFVGGLVVAIAGVMMIGIQDLHLASHQVLGDAVALLAAILLATALLGIEQLRSRFPTPVLMSGVCLVGSLTLAPFILFRWEAVMPTCWKTGLAVLALALVCQVVGHGLLTYSLQRFSSGFIAVSMLAIPILSSLVALILFSQRLSLMNWCAFSIVLAGIYLSISAAHSGKDTVE